MSEKVDIFMPIYIGDYLKDTTFLTTAEHGAYLLMLMACWQHGAIPNKSAVICRITGLTKAEWDDLKETIMPYFKIRGGEIHHSRVDRELEAAREKKKKAVSRGKAGADARWKKDRPSNGTSNGTSKKQAMLKQCPSPSPSPSPLTTPLPSSAEVEGISDPDHKKMIIEVLNCRPEFSNLNVEFLRKAIHDAGANPRLAENHAEFIADMANSLNVPDIPAKKYMRYLQSDGLRGGRKRETGGATI